MFSNIYLNEFDRFVRHHLKPQAYVRYGDDFLLFLSTRREAFLVRWRANQFLHHQINLYINPKNDIVIAVHQGLRFLGHEITVKSALVDKHTTAKVLSNVGTSNISSYKALYLETSISEQLDWILLQNNLLNQLESTIIYTITAHNG